MKRFLIAILCLLPLPVQAADSTDYVRNRLSCLSDDPTGCHPDYKRTFPYSFDRRFSEMGWVHVELTMPDLPTSQRSEIALCNGDGTVVQKWIHEGKGLDMFQVWAPVFSGQYLSFNGKYDAVTKSVFHPCILTR